MRSSRSSMGAKPVTEPDCGYPAQARQHSVGFFYSCARRCSSTRRCFNDLVIRHRPCLRRAQREERKHRNVRFASRDLRGKGALEDRSKRIDHLAHLARPRRPGGRHLSRDIRPVDDRIGRRLLGAAQESARLRSGVEPPRAGTGGSIAKHDRGIADPTPGKRAPYGEGHVLRRRRSREILKRDV